MHLNHLLHRIVDKLPHASEDGQSAMHEHVDLAVEPPPLPVEPPTEQEISNAEVQELREQMKQLLANQAAAASPVNADDTAPADS